MGNWCDREDIMVDTTLLYFYSVVLCESRMYAYVCIVHYSLSFVLSNRIQSQGRLSIVLYYVIRVADLTDVDIGI